MPKASISQLSELLTKEAFDINLVKEEEMKRIVLLLMLLNCFVLWAQNSNPSEADFLQEKLMTATKNLDAMLRQTQASLQSIASSPAAIKGEWPAIKAELQKLEQAIPAVYFYVLPDGNYYSVEKDFTNLNLSNREYFPALMEGKQINGFALYSRSTGKKAALMACPIMDQDKVLGALGASIYTENLHLSINEKLDLPEDYSWFVVDSNGLVIVDFESEYIFVNALTQAGALFTKSLGTGF